MIQDGLLSQALRDRWLERGMRLMVESGDAREADGRVGVMWALLREAAQVSRSWPAPPRPGHGSRSVMPEARETVTEWQRAVFAFEEGLTVTQMYGRAPRHQWTAEQHSHAEITLDLFHRAALALSGDRRRLRRAVYAYALGAPPRKIKAQFGLSRFQLSRAKGRAMTDMADEVIGAEGEARKPLATKRPFR